MKKDLCCYFGTTGGKVPPQEQGIYVCKLNTHTGQLGGAHCAVKTVLPSFLAAHPGGEFLYATHETSDGAGAAAFLIDGETGSLESINFQLVGGSGACHVSLDATGRVLFVANYGSGSLASMPVAADGSLGQAVSMIQNQGSGPTQRQKGPHAHSINVDPSNRFALACDLGTDQVLVFKLEPATAKLTPNDPPSARVPAGGGPRHLVFHPTGKFVYVVNELANTVTAFAWDCQHGRLCELQNITTLPPGWNKESYTAEIRVHPTGEFLYVSNRGHDSIAILKIDQTSGNLSGVGFTPTGGKWPRHFEIDPSGQWLVVANEHSNNVIAFRIDEQTGELRSSDSRVELPSPSCVRFVP